MRLAEFGRLTMKKENTYVEKLGKASTQGSLARKIHLLYDVAMALLCRIIRYPAHAHSFPYRLVMLFDDEIELARYEAILQVSPQEQTVPVSTQLETVKQTYPDFNVTQFVPAKTADIANRFSIQNQEGSSLIVAVNPYTGDVQGTIDRSDSIYELMNSIHGTLLIGDLGDRLIEIAASLGILLLVSGLYLWLPRDNASRAGFMKIRFGNGTRILMRDLHANLGGVLSIVLLFFLISGLSWAGVWGAKMVQAWNTFPTYYTWARNQNRY